MVLDDQASDPVPVLSGVPQGQVLGSVLFLIFINYLPENIRSPVRLFADDCVLYPHNDCQILQDDLNSLAQWESDWQMKFNVAKCHSMRVTRHLPENQMQFEYSLHQQKWNIPPNILELLLQTIRLGSTCFRNATKTMGFLWHNLALAPRHTKEVAYKTGGGVVQWLWRRISDQGVPGSNPGRCTFRCGLEQVTFTLFSTG